MECTMIVFWFLCAVISFQTGYSLKPVILIPGDGGSQLEGRVDHTWRDGGDCPKPTDWQRLWVNVLEFLPGNTQCWSKKMELVYDTVLRRSQTPTGVYTRVPGFGTTESVEYLDPSLAAYALVGKAPYFADMVHEMVSWGYQRGHTVRGAPYDFRFAPHSQRDYFIKLKNLIETMYQECESRVVLITHSAGGLFATNFLNKQSILWKQRHIDSLVTMGTPWDGSPMMFYAYASGFNLNISALNPLTVRNQERTSETNAWILPREPTFSSSKAFVLTNRKNYSLSNIEEFFQDIGFINGRFLLQDVSGSDYILRHPGVDVKCWYGVGVATPQTFIYSQNQFPDGQPDDRLFVDGDGMVTADSLGKCELWRNEIGRFNTVSVKTYHGQDHLEMLRNRNMFEDLKRVLF